MEAAQRREYADYFAAAQGDSPEWAVIDDLLYRVSHGPGKASHSARLCLPHAGGYRLKVTDKAHSELCHMSGLKTYLRILSVYYWPGMKKQVFDFVDKCPTCALHNKRYYTTKAANVAIPDTPWQVVSADVFGPMPISKQGNIYALVAICNLTRWVECIAMPSRHASSIQKALQDMVSRMAMPRVVLTDNAKELKSVQLETWFKRAGILHKTTTPYWPRGNSLAERVIKLIKASIAKQVSNVPSEWENALPLVLLAIRTTTAVHGFSPFFLLYGRDPVMPESTHDQDALPKVEWLEKLEVVREKARSAIQESRRYNHARLNKTTGPDFQPGQRVLLQAPPNCLPLTSVYDGPFRVVKTRGPAIVIQDNKGKRRVVNRVYLKLAPAIGKAGRNKRPKRKVKQRTN